MLTKSTWKKHENTQPTQSTENGWFQQHTTSVSKHYISYCCGFKNTCSICPLKELSQACHCFQDTHSRTWLTLWSFSQSQPLLPSSNATDLSIENHWDLSHNRLSVWQLRHALKKSNRPFVIHGKYLDWEKTRAKMTLMRRNVTCTIFDTIGRHWSNNRNCNLRYKEIAQMKKGY